MKMVMMCMSIERRLCIMIYINNSIFVMMLMLMMDSQEEEKM